MQMEDVLCDFCLISWTADKPFMEGHHGSHICGACLSDAFRTTVLFAGDPPYTDMPAIPCTMCIEDRTEPCFDSAKRKAHICRRCVKMAAVTLERDAELGWKRPER